MNNDFTNSLKVNVEPTYSIGTTESLLKDLGIFPLPENVEVKLSEDNKYLNLRLISNTNKKHILFQIPLQEHDLSAIQNHPNYHELFNRYNTYINEYMDEIKQYALQERAYLQTIFPNLVFNIKIRIKSYDSYMNKLNENILDGKSPFINDIIAERIVISEYNGSTDEEILTPLCDEVAKALYDFRINTNFRMKNTNEIPSKKEYVSKDYIRYPKPNGYQALHILMQNKHNHDFTYETQIKTFEMEHMSKTCDEIAHNKYKPRIINELAANKVPLYSVITSFNDNSGNPIILDASFENRFYHFYNTSTNNHQLSDSERSIPISYTNFKKELYEIESSLGITFKEIREKLKNIEIVKELNKSSKSNYTLEDTSK